MNKTCAEPDGQRIPEGTEYTSMHDLMLSMSGQCPWCGEED